LSAQAVSVPSLALGSLRSHKPLARASPRSGGPVWGAAQGAHAEGRSVDESGPLVHRRTRPYRCGVRLRKPLLLRISMRIAAAAAAAAAERLRLPTRLRLPHAGAVADAAAAPVTCSADG